MNCSVDPMKAELFWEFETFVEFPCFTFHLSSPDEFHNSWQLHLMNMSKWWYHYVLCYHSTPNERHSQGVCQKAATCWNDSQLFGSIQSRSCPRSRERPQRLHEEHPRRPSRHVPVIYGKEQSDASRPWSFEGGRIQERNGACWRRIHCCCDMERALRAFLSSLPSAFFFVLFLLQQNQSYFC